MIFLHPKTWKIFVFSLAFCITSCAAFKPEKTFSRNGLTLTFRSLNALDDIQNIKFIYPIILSEKQVLNHLLSLWHQRIVSPGKPKPVFSLDEAAKLSSLFSTALKKVEPKKFLNFKFQSSKGLIEGQVFATAKKLHWRFLKINNEDFSNDPLRIRKPTWKLVRMPGQTYQKLQSSNFIKKVKNRIIANINLPFPKQRSQSRLITRKYPKKPTQSASEKLELKSKLDALERFLNLGIIDKIEYEKKKASLMNQYFKVHD
jgi:hypothetical protein